MLARSSLSSSGLGNRRRSQSPCFAVRSEWFTSGHKRLCDLCAVRLITHWQSPKNPFRQGVTRENGVPSEMAGDGFRHQALIYHGPEEYLAGTVPFLREGLEAGQSVL